MKYRSSKWDFRGPECATDGCGVLAVPGYGECLSCVRGLESISRGHGEPFVAPVRGEDVCECGKGVMPDEHVPGSLFPKPQDRCIQCWSEEHMGF